MRLLPAIILPALCCAAKSISPLGATVMLYDPQSEPRPVRTLSPVSARLVLAQRAGVEEYHSTDLQVEGVVDAINEFGMKTSLFAPARSNVQKAMILLEEGTGSDDTPAVHSTSHFELSPAPDAPAMKGLFIDMARQSRPEHYAHHTDDELYSQLKSHSKVPKHNNLFHIAPSMADLEALYNRLVESGKWSITVITVPAAKTGQTSTESAIWGTYEMPGSQSSLKKRQQKEELLTDTTEFKPVHFSSAPLTPLAESGPLRGILPSCFSSQSACESATRNCTGHGSCSRKYHDSTAKTNKDCYACSCSATKSSNGKVTTHWGGPACQKKDVSVQFWLIALFTVGLVFVVGFAIGQIWEMGDQELPSVIGAGVSGPTARK